MQTQDQSKRLLSPRDGLVSGGGIDPDGALANLFSSELVDGALCVVRNVAGLYEYRAASSDAQALPNVVAPADGVGRWVQIANLVSALPSGTTLSSLLAWSGNSWRVSTPTFDVTDFGAVGDGVTNATVAITAAKAAATAVGGVVVVPPGTFLTNSLALDARFLAGGKLKPATGQTVTLSLIEADPEQVIVDRSAGGTLVCLANAADSYHARWWGCDGTGNSSIDDQPALQAAIDGTPVFGTLYIPQGAYYVFSSLIINKSIWVEGVGAYDIANRYALILAKTSAVNVVTLDLDGTQALIGLSHLGLRGGLRGIHIDCGTTGVLNRHSRFEDLWVFVNTVGVHIDCASSAQVTGVTFENVEMRQNKCNLLARGATFMNATKWIGCTSTKATALTIGTIREDAASASASTQPPLGTWLAVIFPSGWDGGDITVSGTVGGAPDSETFVYPGTAGVVRGTKIFTAVDASGIVNSAPGGTTDTATVKGLLASVDIEDIGGGSTNDISFQDWEIADNDFDGIRLRYTRVELYTPHFEDNGKSGTVNAQPSYSDICLAGDGAGGTATAVELHGGTFTPAQPEQLDGSGKAQRILVTGSLNNILHVYGTQFRTVDQIDANNTNLAAIVFSKYQAPGIVNAASANLITGNEGLLISTKLGSTSTAAGTTLGNVVGSVPVYDADGALVGYAPLYDGIT